MKTLLFAGLAMSAIIITGCVTDQAPRTASGAMTSNDDVITEKYWKLVELNGHPVTPGPNDTYITLKLDGQRVIGSGGCNRLAGTYTLGAMNRLRFSQIVSTEMACMEGMETETHFLDVLNRVDSYDVKGDKLVLNKARMAPLARFEAVYMQ
jgi:heat shock protein HslJ